MQCRGAGESQLKKAIVNGRWGAGWGAIVCVALTVTARTAFAAPGPNPAATCFTPLVPTPALPDPLVYGHATARSGDLVVVGADDDAHSAPEPIAGAIYTFQRTGGAWSQQGGALRPTESDPGDGFGETLALAGSTLLAGARGRGGAYVFERAGAGWAERAFLAPPSGQGELYLALEGDTAVLSMTFRQPTDIRAALFVFTLDAQGQWARQGEALTIANAELGDCTPGPIAISGETLLVGAPVLGSDATSAGKAFVFVRQGGQWQRQGPALTGDDNPLFGASVALSGEAALIGSHRAWAANPSQPDGSVYAFRRSAQAWAVQGAPWRQAGSDGFGRALAILGERAFVGAPPGMVAPEGAVYAYRRSDQSWAAVDSPRYGLGKDPELGISLGLSATGLSVGSAGVAYAVELACLDGAQAGDGGSSGEPGSSAEAGMAGSLSASGGTLNGGSAGTSNRGGASSAGLGVGACAATDACVETPVASDGDATASACGCRLSAPAPTRATLALLGLAGLALLVRRRARCDA